MAIDLESAGQMSFLNQGSRRTIVSLPEGHRLLVLHDSIPWAALMQKAIPILYEEQGISRSKGRILNLQAHLGAYILQTVHGWTDRWTEEMIRYYIPARIFCGFWESTGSLDRTRIEDFRNRFGEKGARLITQDMLNVAREFGFTAPEDLDMDTTVGEAGITHPTEMKLINHMMKKALSIHKKLTSFGKKGLRGVKKAAKKFSKVYTDYRFFAKTKVKKSKAIKRAVRLANTVMQELTQLKIGRSGLKGLSLNIQKDILRLQELGPKLLSQILYWLKSGKVAQDKIVSLWKSVPRALPKGKIGKAVEFGRKWIVNCYRGGYVLLAAPGNAKISDQHCVAESLNLHLEVFQESPVSYGTDRGMWSEENIFQCQMAQVKKIGIQPKGKAKPMVSQKDYKQLKNRRAGIEPRIGHLKQRGLGRSRMKSDMGDLISGYRSALSYNLTLLMRDLKLQIAN
jgi:glycosyltransferase involved in cell wall biosynthesis